MGYIAHQMALGAVDQADGNPSWAAFSGVATFDSGLVQQTALMKAFADKWFGPAQTSLEAMLGSSGLQRVCSSQDWFDENCPGCDGAVPTCTSTNSNSLEQCWGISTSRPNLTTDCGSAAQDAGECFTLTVENWKDTGDAMAGVLKSGQKASCQALIEASSEILNVQKQRTLVVKILHTMTNTIQSDQKTTIDCDINKFYNDT